MMKKTIFLVFMAFAAAAALSAFEPPKFELSAGGGLDLGGQFTRYTLEGEKNMDPLPVTFKIHADQSQDQFNYGGWLFFDATYAELSVDVLGGANRYNEKTTIGTLVNTEIPNEGTGTNASLGITLLAKYPFTITERLKLFPLAGMEYRVTLMEKRTPKDGTEYDRTEADKEFPGKTFALSAWNSWAVNAGLGADWQLSGPLFLRAELLYNFRLETQYEHDSTEYVKTMIPNVTIDNLKLSGLTSGPELRVALGYRF